MNSKSIRTKLPPFPKIYTSAIGWTLLDLLIACRSICLKDKSSCLLERMLKKEYCLSEIIITDLGRNALKLALKATSIEKQSKVMIPSIVCPTVIESVLAVGYTPVLCDVDFNLHASVRTISQCYWKHNQKIKILIIPHIYNLNAPIDEIECWCRANNVILIDDAAQAVGSKYKSALLGTYGDMGIVSFGPYKNLGSSRGGAVLFKNAAFAKNIKKNFFLEESNYSIVKRIIICRIKYHNTFRFLFFRAKKIIKSPKNNTIKRRILGENKSNKKFFSMSKIERLLAARLITRSKSIFLERKKTTASVLNKIKNLKHIRAIDSQNRPYIRLPLILAEGLSVEKVINYLRDSNIEAERIYRPLHFYEKYKKYATHPLPNSEKLWRSTILVPNPFRYAETGIMKLIITIKKIILI